MPRFVPLLLAAAAAAAAAAGAIVARRRRGAGGDAPIDASATASDPAERAAAVAATPVGPPPAETPGDAEPEEAPPAERHTVGLYVLHQGARADRAYTALARALGDDATLGEPDRVGRFDAQVAGATLEAAKQRVRDAFRSSGTGDDFTIVTTTQGREMPDDDPRQPDR